MARRRLSEAEIARIVELREAGWGYARIAAEMGCSANTITWHCLRHAADPPRPGRCWAGVKGPAVMRRGNHVVRRYTPEEDERLLAMEQEGLGVCEIARRLGRKPNSVIGRLMTLARRAERAEAGLC